MSEATERRSDEATKGSRAGRLFWPGIIFVLLGSLVAANVTLLVVALCDPAIVVGDDSSVVEQKASER